MPPDNPAQKWYYATYALIIALLCVGPLALPLVWFNPRFSGKSKMIISIIVIVLTYFLGIAFIGSLNSLKQSYRL